MTEQFQTEQERFYRLYREYTFKSGSKWAHNVGVYEKRRSNPFSTVTREVNSNMRRFLGAEKYTKNIALLEYLMIKEGLLIKDAKNNLDVPLTTFQLWLE